MVTRTLLNITLYIHFLSYILVLLVTVLWQATDDNIIWSMLFACWITKATHTRSEFVILFFPRQQLGELALMLRYAYNACLVCNEGTNFSYLKLGDNSKSLSLILACIIYLILNNVETCSIFLVLKVSVTSHHGQRISPFVLYYLLWF
jgi:hypothetical protein